MEMTPVDSSWIESIGHDPETSTLHLRTKSGRDYHFADTSAEEHAALMKADSHGAHFNQKLRGKLFKLVKAEAGK